MNFDDGAIDHGVLHIRLIRAGLEQPSENAGLGPVAVALEDAVPVTEECRKIAPRTSCPRDPEHRFNKAAVVTSAPARVRWFAQTVRLHLRPLRVGQYESFHPKLESQTSVRWNPESQQALGRALVMGGYRRPRRGAEPNLAKTWRAGLASI